MHSGGYEQPTREPVRSEGEGAFRASRRFVTNREKPDTEKQEVVMHVIQRTCLALSVGGILMWPLPASAADNVSLSGCLVKATDNAGYLVTNAPADAAAARASDTRVSTNSFGATGDFTTVVYWIENANELEPHVGHMVEVSGDLKESKDGEMKIERRDRWSEIELKADGRTLHANVPNPSVLPDPAARKDTKREVIVRRVAVEKVKMLGASCGTT